LGTGSQPIRKDLVKILGVVNLLVVAFFFLPDNSIRKSRKEEEGN
jgi:hypothetical protein